MKRIVLFCSSGFSTSMLVKKMSEAAGELGIECSIDAYSIDQLDEKGKDADAILLGPQARFYLEKVKEVFPHIPSMVIDMRVYGMMLGKEALEEALKITE
jgi:PTS system cellobiose-specific IIB component